MRWDRKTLGEWLANKEKPKKHIDDFKRKQSSLKSAKLIPLKINFNQWIELNLAWFSWSNHEPTKWTCSFLLLSVEARKAFKTFSWWIFQSQSRHSTVSTFHYIQRQSSIFWLFNIVSSSYSLINFSLSSELHYSVQRCKLCSNYLLFFWLFTTIFVSIFLTQLTRFGNFINISTLKLILKSSHVFFILPLYFMIKITHSN